jgi:hypothetical protein
VTKTLATSAVVMAVAIVGGILHFTDADPVVTFLVCGVALGGVAWTIGIATESVGARFGPAVTDSGREIRRRDDKPGVSNLIDILAVATQRSPGEIEVAYEGAGYGDLKRDVGEAVVELLTPVREHYLELRADEAELLRLLALGAEKARAASTPTLEAMYERMGFVRL